MTIRQTVEIPADRRVSFVFPNDTPVGSAEIELNILKFPEPKAAPKEKSATPSSEAANA
jgi:hypothetical protein